MMHEVTPRLAPTHFRDRVFGCFACKILGFLIGSETRLLDNLSAENVHTCSKSVVFGFLNHDLASYDAYKKRQGHPSSYDIAQEWLAKHQYENRSLDQVYDNLRRGLFPPMSGSYRRRSPNPTVCWSRGNLWVLLNQRDAQRLDKAIRTDAEIDCCSNGTNSYAPALAAAQAQVLAGASVQAALEHVMESIDFASASTAIGFALDAAKGYRDPQESMDSYLFSCRRKALNETGFKFGALTLLWMHCDGSMAQALTVSNQAGLLDSSFGVALGGLLGLSSGLSTVGSKLADPVLELMNSVRIAPDQTIDLNAFVDEVVGEAAKGGSDMASVAELQAEYRSRKQDPPPKKSPYRIAISTDGIEIEFDYIHEPEFHICSSRMLSLSVRCKDIEKRHLRVSWSVNEGAAISPAVTESILHPNTRRVFTANCFAYRALEWIEGSVNIGCETNGNIQIPFALALAPSVRYDSLTLKPGTTISADSEANSAPGCLQYVIDGQIGDKDDERHVFWESDDTENTHWLQINLPKPMRTNRIIVHFADRGCHPSSFKAMVNDGGATWTTVGEEIEYVNDSFYEVGPIDIKIKSFRFEVTRSSDRLNPYVTKVSEVEMIPLGRGRNRVR